MSNHLIHETSPYLLQHAENPVDWYPWCGAAFEKAKAEDKPVFLSIGYSTCHWCHVMAHESFENARIAQILNRYYVCIKVDREERPDIDQVYMSVCQVFTGNGGWPMSVFMTWDKKPFFAGTYFPPQGRGGMPGFADVLRSIESQWNSGKRGELLQSAENVISYLKKASADSGDRGGDKGSGVSASEGAEDLAETAVELFEKSFDKVNGGFGAAPKFPTPHNLLFLMLYGQRQAQSNRQQAQSTGQQARDTGVLNMVEKTLEQMRKGGIFDQIGYGFSRYSTDARYLAPHFEKMLYDNALLITAYTAAYSITQKPLYLDTARETAEYALREMVSEEGGFYSAQDADSEGVEGRFYTFTLKEILEVLGEEKGGRFARAFDITEEGNFEGTNIPNLLKSGDLSSDYRLERQKLLEYRKGRARLHLDDKILTSWNSMMIAALAMLYKVTGEEGYLRAAANAQCFIEWKLCDGLQLYTSFRNEKHSESGFLDDYAYYTAALIALYDVTLNRSYLDRAEQFCGEAVRRFSDYWVPEGREDKKGFSDAREGGKPFSHGREGEKRFADGGGAGFHLSEVRNTELFMNPKECYDGAVPSGNSVMAYNLTRLTQLTEKEGDTQEMSRGQYSSGAKIPYGELARRQLGFMAAEAERYPAGYSMFLLAKLIYENPPAHITVVLQDEDKGELKRIIKNVPFLANVRVVPEGGEYPLLNGKTTYYICRGHVCLPPVNQIP